MDRDDDGRESRTIRETPPPCAIGFECPKESPEREHAHVLRNPGSAALRLYLANRATHGAALAGRDLTRFVLRFLTIVDRELRSMERTAALEDMTTALSVNLRAMRVRP